MKLTFIELPLFSGLVTQITDDHFLNQLQNDLLKDPEKGDVVPRLQGLRKVRMALQGRSRASGARVSTFICLGTALSFSFTFIPRLNRKI
jgi:hypothetical protein